MGTVGAVGGRLGLRDDRVVDGRQHGLHLKMDASGGEPLS
jgi:hypothetical protein